MNSSGSCLQILEDVLGEELYDVNKGIGGCNTVLQGVTGY
jgi:hypothetical protein